MAGIVNEAYTLIVRAQESGGPEASVNIRAWDSTSPTPVERINKTTDAQGVITPTVITAEIHSITGTATRATTVLNPIKIRALKWPLSIEEISVNLSSPSTQTFFMVTNPNITETNQTTVNGYTGFAINDGAGTITLNAGTWNQNRLYDRVQSVAITSPFQGVARGQPIETLDGVNFTQRYDITVSGITFDGNGATYSGGDWTIAGANGNLQETSITGQLNLTSQDADLQDVVVDGDIRVNFGAANVTLDWINVECTGNVFNDGTGTLTINAVGSSLTTTEPGTGGGQVNILQLVLITLTGLEPNTEVRAYTQDINGDNDVEIAGVENSGTSFAFSAGSGETINIMINNLFFLPADIWGFVVPATSTSIPVAQFPDRQYENPT